MKKLFCFIFALNFIYFCYNTFTDFAYECDSGLWENKNYANIQKPDEMSQEQFISTLTDIAEKNGCDIMVQFYFSGDSDNKPCTKIYKTSFHDGSLNIHTAIKTDRLPQGKYFTTKKTDDTNAIAIYSPAVYGDIEVYDFSGIVDYNLSNTKFYISGNAPLFITALGSNGIGCGTPDNILSSRREYFIEPMIMLLLFLLLSVMIYVYSLRKEFIIKKLAGWSNTDITLSEFLQLFRLFGITVLAVLGVMLTVMGIMYGTFTPILYIAYCGVKILMVLLLFFYILFITLFMICRNSNPGAIKGQSANAVLYAVTTAVKFFVLMLAASSLALLTVNISIYKTSYNNYRSLSEKIKNYVTTEVNISSGSMSDETKEKICNVLLDKFGGVLIDCCNYQDYNGITFDDLDSFSGITVNPNYFNLVTIYDVNGNRLTPDTVLSGKKAVALLPEGTDPDNYLKEVISFNTAFNDDFTEYDAGVVFYKTGSKFYTFSSQVKYTDSALPDAPVMVTRNDLNAELAGHYLSSSSIILDISSEDIESKLQPTLIKEGGDAAKMPFKSIATMFSSDLKNSKDRLYSAIAGIIGYSAIMLIVVTYGAWLYCLSFRRSIAVKKISGYGYLKINWALYVFKLIAYILFYVIYWQNDYSVYVSGPWAYHLVVLLDFIGTFIATHIIQRKSVTDIIRGDE